MKRTNIARLLLVVALAISSFCCYADVIPMYSYSPALHRIGYEILVYVASAIAGSALVRYIAKKNWYIAEKKGHLDGEKWKSISDLKEVEAAEIAEKIREIRQPLHTAVRKVYDKVDGFLEEGWKYDLVLSALEDDEELMMRCKGIPIECLMVEAGNAVKDEIEVRTAGVLLDFKRLFDAAYEVKMREWLKAESKMMRYYVKDSFWNGIRRLLSSKYRHKALEVRRELIGVPGKNPIPSRWRSLCLSLAESILERTRELKTRCRGVARLQIIWAVCGKDCPRDFHGLISDTRWREYLCGRNYEDLGKPLIEESRTVIRDEVDIEKVLKNLREHTVKNLWEPAVFGGDVETFQEYEEGKTRDTASELERRPRLVQSATEVKSAIGRWRMAVCEGGGDEPRNMTYLPDHAILVGRSRSADLRLSPTNCEVSGRHCELIVTQEGASLHVVSRNGAMVDGKLYSEGELVKLYVGDRISLGNTARIEILEVPPAPSATN